MSKIELIEKLVRLIAKNEGGFLFPPEMILTESTHPLIKQWVKTSYEVLELTKNHPAEDNVTPQVSTPILDFHDEPSEVFQNHHNGDRLSQQFNKVKAELTYLPGFTFGKQGCNDDDLKAWFVSWNGSPAMLYWTVGNGWEIGVRKNQKELRGDWEGFDLMEHLANNNVDTEDWG